MSRASIEPVRHAGPTGFVPIGGGCKHNDPGALAGDAALGQAALGHAAPRGPTAPRRASEA
jgi:hypothetical protein